MISFNVPPYVGKELDYIKQAIENKKIVGLAIRNNDTGKRVFVWQKPKQHST